MNRCEQIQNRIAEYWDLPEDHSHCIEVDRHIAQCETCAEQFRLWSESRDLIRDGHVFAEDPNHQQPSRSIADQVMNRIYKEESWKFSIALKMYNLSDSVRRNVTIILSFCLALFVISFLRALFARTNTTDLLNEESYSAIVPVASAVGDRGRDLNQVFDAAQGVPVASISDPLIFRVGHVPTSPDYFLIFSILGMAMTILTINWLSRIKA